MGIVVGRRREKQRVHATLYSLRCMTVSISPSLVGENPIVLRTRIVGMHNQPRLRQYQISAPSAGLIFKVRLPLLRQEQKGTSTKGYLFWVALADMFSSVARFDTESPSCCAVEMSKVEYRPPSCCGDIKKD